MKVLHCSLLLSITKGWRAFKDKIFTVSIFSVGVKNWFLPSNFTPTEKIETVSIFELLMVKFEDALWTKPYSADVKKTSFLRKDVNSRIDKADIIDSY